MHREKISAGKAGMSEASFPCESSVLLYEQEEMPYGKAATGMESSSSLHRGFSPQKHLGKHGGSTKKVFKSTTLHSP